NLEAGHKSTDERLISQRFRVPVQCVARRRKRKNCIFEEAEPHDEKQRAQHKEIHETNKGIVNIAQQSLLRSPQRIMKTTIRYGSQRYSSPIVKMQMYVMSQTLCCEA